MTPDDMLPLGTFLAINFLAAASGAIFKPGKWYEGLRKPGWTPPNLAFPIVWTVLFILNAIAGWLVWRQAGFDALLDSPALTVYGVSLVINALWSALFFGAKRMDWAMADVVLLWVSIAATMVLFQPYSPVSSLLQAPYLVWVTIAAALNYRVMQLNPRRAG